MRLMSRHEGAPRRLRIPSLEKAIGHDSPGYNEALRALGNGAVRDIRIIEGLE